MKHGYIVVDAGILHSQRFQNVVCQGSCLFIQTVFLTTWPITVE